VRYAAPGAAEIFAAPVKFVRRRNKSFACGRTRRRVGVSPKNRKMEDIFRRLDLQK
jgi:hypothetical protein